MYSIDRYEKIEWRTPEPGERSTGGRSEPAARAGMNGRVPVGTRGLALAFNPRPAAASDLWAPPDAMMKLLRQPAKRWHVRA
jgi:hypothetical protein